MGKCNWTEKEAEKWVKEHAEIAEIINEVIDLNLGTIQEDLEIAPYKTNEDLPLAVKKYPKGAQDAFRETFNNVYERTGGDESKAFPIAWNSLKRWMKKHKGEETK